MRLASFIALTALSLGVAAYAVAVYVLMPLGAAVHPDMRGTFEAHDRLTIYAHVFPSAFALALGGLAGLNVAFNAFGGPVARIGFACLAAPRPFYESLACRAATSRRKR